ncbi:MAG: nicotinate (nicotinamide) nucleotide adenylyltransferase, partial [Clostridia bacterium]|nr:nicotinate (nicotinamide) nucleotide adenylyltransferase [Clostridia bacterium]
WKSDMNIHADKPIRKTGLFGGTFAPPHLGHLHAAKTFLREVELDELIIMPACIPPHKQKAGGDTPEIRYRMCRSLFRDLPSVTVSDYEIQRGGLSYTYQTLQELKQARPEITFFFLAGGDSLRDFFYWKNPDIIASLCELCVLPRADSPHTEEYVQAYRRAYGKSPIILQGSVADISSTECRLLTLCGADTSEVMPAEVAGYIAERGLYAPTSEQKELFDRVRSMQGEKRWRHTVYVAIEAITLAKRLKCDERKAFTAAILHDVAKRLSAEELKKMGCMPEGEYPDAVLHAFAGALVAERLFGEKDEDILNAIRYHTTARAGMSLLERIIYIADCVEKTRTYPDALKYRALVKADFESGFVACISEILRILEEKNPQAVYPLTREAVRYYTK